MKKVYINTNKYRAVINIDTDKGIICPLTSYRSHSEIKEFVCSAHCAWFDAHKIKEFPLLTLSDDAVGVVTCKNSVIGELVDPPEVKP